MSSIPASPANWTSSALSSIVRQVHDAAVRERTRISMNNARIMRMDVDANRVADATARARLKSRIAELVKQQVRAASAWRTFSAKYTAALNAARKWLAPFKVTLASDLNLGALPVVPIVVAGAVLLAWAYVAKVASESKATEASIALTQRELDMVRQGTLTPEQLQAIERARAKSMEQQRDHGGDILGLTGALQAATPLVLIVAAAMILPKLLPQRRAA